MFLLKTAGRRLFAAAVLLAPFAATAGPYAYLDDANVQSDGPVVNGNFPKIMLTETQSAKGTPESFTKYDLIGAKAGMIRKLTTVQGLNSGTEFHYGFSPRAYQGGDMKNPCELSSGITFKNTGPATENCNIYAGHWLYFAGTQLSQAVSATAKVLYVNDASKLEVGKYVVIYDAPAGSFKNAEHAKVTAISKNTTPHKVTLAARGYKSTPKSHPKNAIVAQHALGRGGGGDDPKNWAFNQAFNGPLDSKNRTIAEAMVNWLDANLIKSSKGVNTGIRVDGIYFDADPYFNTPNKNRVDSDNDLVADGFMTPSGENLWGKGVEEFYALVRQRFPGKRVVGGMRNTRGFDSLNGTQMEGFPAGGNFDAKIPDYGHSGGNDGFDSVFQRYMIHLQYHKPNQGYVENLLKAPTKLYDHGLTGVNSNAPFRLAFAATLLGDGHFGQQNSKHEADPWYDEYAVNTTEGSAKYGHAVPSNPNNETAVLNAKGWLGRPLGTHERLYDSAAFAPNKSMLSNGGFEGGDNGWKYDNVVTQVVSSGAKEGSKALKLLRHAKFTSTIGGAWIKGPQVTLQQGQQYTLVFAARAAKMREVSVRVDGTKSNFLVPDRWTRIVHTFKATKSGPANPQFNVGQEETPLWIDAVYLFKGNANVFLREFDNGIVVVNATPSSRTVDLGEPFLRIKGTGQDPVNNGAQVSSVNIPAYDAAILVRTEPGAPGGGGTGGGGTGGGGTGGGGTGGGGTGGGGTGGGGTGGGGTGGGGTGGGGTGGGGTGGGGTGGGGTGGGGTGGGGTGGGGTGGGGTGGGGTGGGGTGGGGTGGGGTGGGGTGGGGSAVACGKPAMSRQATGRVYAWRECGSNRWHVRATLRKSAATFNGVVTTKQGQMVNITRIKLENHDKVSFANNRKKINFNFKLWNGNDQFRFVAPASGVLCLKLNSPGNAKVFVGKNAKSVGKAVNLRNGKSCTP